jgi:hypothetical protein
MYSVLFAPWSNTNRMQLDLLAQTYALFAEASRSWPTSGDPAQWRALASHSLKTFSQLSDERDAKSEDLWHGLRDKLDLARTAQSLRSLHGIDADVVGRIGQANSRCVTAFIESMASCMQATSSARDANDISLATVEMGSALQNALKDYVTDLARTGSGVLPAWVQWLRTSVDDASAGSAQSDAKAPRGKTQ